jgi:hypothetical protein
LYEPALLRIRAVYAYLQGLNLGSNRGCFTKARKAFAEAFYLAAHVVGRFLGAGVKRVGCAGSIQFVEGKFLPVFKFDVFFGVNARTDDELLAIGYVYKAYLAVLGMDIFFHACLSRGGFAGG